MNDDQVTAVVKLTSRPVLLVVSHSHLSMPSSPLANLKLTVLSFELYFSHVAKIACPPKELATLQSAPKLYHGLVVKVWNKGHRTIMMGKFYRSRKSSSLSSTLMVRMLCTLGTNQKPANLLVTRLILPRTCVSVKALVMLIRELQAFSTSTSTSQKSEK